MVDGQINAVGIEFGVVRQQTQGGDVGGHHLVRHKIRRCLIGAEVGGGAVSQTGVGQQICRLAQRPQSGAQSGGAAHGVAVRAHMGQDQNVVKSFQQSGGFLNGQQTHSSSFVSNMGPRASSARST